MSPFESGSVGASCETNYIRTDVFVLEILSAGDRCKKLLEQIYRTLEKVAVLNKEGTLDCGLVNF